MCAQIVHAAGESVATAVLNGTHAVVLSVPNVAKLLALERELVEKKIPHKLIVEPDPPYLGEPMAIGISPTTKNNVSGVLGSLPLLK
jgi:peptidyl-tRNA hydrolase